MNIGDTGFDKYSMGWNGSSESGHVGKHMMMNVDQSGYSDSNSEVSVSESVVATTNNHNMGEFENVGDDGIMNKGFIDFLGVGAT